MIEMDRNNVGLFRWDGRSSLRNAAPCNQPGNRHLRSDDGNRGIDCNSGRLVHGEILRHLRAIRACWALRRVRGFLFAGVSFIHGNLQQKTTGQLIEDRRIPSFSAHFSKRDRDFRQESTISVFFDKRRTGNCSPDSTNVSDSGRDLTSKARSARNAFALRWQTISERRLYPSECWPHRFCSKRA